MKFVVSLTLILACLAAMGAVAFELPIEPSTFLILFVLLCLIISVLKDNISVKTKIQKVKK